MSKYLFLYGTLRPDMADSEIAAIVGRLRSIGRGYVHGKLYDLGDYPGAIVDPSSSSLVRGLLVQLPPEKEVLEVLDRYEEFDPANPGQSLFIRTKTKVRLTDGRNVQGWIYVYNRNPGEAPVIRGGHYSKSKVA